MDKAYSSLARKLKDKKYFFGRPTSLDAKVYSHLLYHSACKFLHNSLSLSLSLSLCEQMKKHESDPLSLPLCLSL